jgi:hypothetical protein
MPFTHKVTPDARHSVKELTRTPGRRLEPEVQRAHAAYSGRDLSGVRIHADEVQVGSPSWLQRCGPVPCDCTSREKELAMRKSAPESSPSHESEIPSSVHEVLKTPGEPLATQARAVFEPRFGHDFTRVRVHADPAAAESAQQIAAHAYTVGEHVVFGAGQYQPATPAGRKIIAHELTHVIQQRAAGSVAVRPARISDPHSLEERQAEAAAEGVLTEPSLTVPGIAHSPDRIQRTPDDSQDAEETAQAGGPGPDLDNITIPIEPNVDGSERTEVVEAGNLEEEPEEMSSAAAPLAATALLQRQAKPKGRPRTPPVPTLGNCVPVRHDHAPAAPWSTLQAGFRSRCGSAAGDAASQAGRAIRDILGGRRPSAPRMPNMRGSVDCVCAYGTPSQAAWAALARVRLAGPLAAAFYMHFLGGSGTDLTIDVADVIARDAGVRRRIKASITRGRSGTTSLRQHDYAVEDFQYAFGAIDCVQWRRIGKGMFEISMLDYYEFHPERPGVSQCAHTACVQLVADGSAKNFWMRGSATVKASDL